MISVSVSHEISHWFEKQSFTPILSQNGLAVELKPTQQNKSINHLWWHWKDHCRARITVFVVSFFWTWFLRLLLMSKWHPSGVQENVYNVNVDKFYSMQQKLQDGFKPRGSTMHVTKLACRLFIHFIKYHVLVIQSLVSPIRYRLDIHSKHWKGPWKDYTKTFILALHLTSFQHSQRHCTDAFWTCF